MIVRTADKYYFLSRPPHIADVRISGNVRSQVSKVAGAICVWQPACDQQR
jgi:hypothetical protein